jgi:RHS repeat-associated protein
MLKNRQISRVCRKRRKVTQKAVLSYLYVHDSVEDGTLIAQTLAGGASTTWGQSAKYVHLPTASGPMPVAAIYGTKHYAIQSDHLNTPRRLIQSDGQVAWQWAYSAFGDEQPTIASNRFANIALNQSFGTTTVPAVTFNLRYPGQYFDQESNLHYNYHRSYSATTGRYTQSDPIDLAGGWNRFGYVSGNPLSRVDALGLAEWRGWGKSLALGAYTREEYDLKTDCINGFKHHIRVTVNYLGFSVGAAALQWTAEFEDHFPKPNALAFGGPAFSYVFGGALGVGTAYGRTMIGTATSVGWSPVRGLGGGAGASLGIPNLEILNSEKCDCP